MTSDPSQIQSLIKEIDEVLSKTTPRLPWVMSSDAAQQRQVLEQTRNYLLQSLQQAQSAVPPASNPAHPTVNPVDQSLAPVSAAAVTEASAQQVLQAVVQEMNYLRSNMLQPMRSDVDALRLQRDALTQEIRQLEMQRQQYQLPQNPQAITEFLRATMAQMQENLAGQMAQMMATLMPQAPDPQRLAGGVPPLSLEGDPNLAALSPAERLQYMQRLQSQSDQLMLRLDATLRVVFESLQNNLTSYRDALEEGLGRMHETGQQGEAVFGAFVTRLAQMMGREASPFIQGQSGDWRSDRPYLREAGVKETADFQINQLLQELNALDPSPLNQAIPGEPIPFDPSLAIPENLPADLETASLEQLDRELSRLDLMALPTEVELSENEITVLSDASFPEGLDDELEMADPSFQVPEPILPPPAQTGLTEAELESALDLLSQITAETTPAEAQPTQPAAGFAAPAADMPLVAQPETLYEDEFYQSLFGQSPVSDEVSSGESERFLEPDEAAAFPSEIASLLDQDSEPAEQVAGGDAEADTDLFAGLPDPALQVAEATDTPALEIPTPSFPQSLENLLLQSPEPAAPFEAETLEGFFVGEEDESLGAVPEATPDSIETIASLLELVPDSVIPAEHTPDQSLDASVARSRTDAPEESYELAQPGEDLLANSLTHAVELPELQLPLDTLQQLTADLSNLEATRDASPTPGDEAGWQLDDWMTQSADTTDLAPANSEPTLPQPAVPDITIEDLLFGDDLDSVVVESSVVSAFTAIDSLEQPAASTSEFKTANELLESTIEDWFASVEAESVEAQPEEGSLGEAESGKARPEIAPLSNPETDTNSDLFAWYEQATGKKMEEGTNAFTLDGLDDLFEGAPPLGTSTSAKNQEEPSELTIDTAFGGDEPTSARGTSPENEKKKREFGA